jgi:hypothetical protein
MSTQVAGTGIAANVQASFLRGGIATRHLPSADITPYIERSKPYPLQGATSTTFQCTNNPHIPACRVPTDGCGTTITPTDNTCATLVSNCDC